MLVVKVPHALDFLLDVFHEIGFLSELLFVDALDGVDLVLG